MKKDNDIQIKYYTKLLPEEMSTLKYFLSGQENRIFPYQTIEFANVLDDVFDYENFSIVAFRGSNAVGFLPQWKKGKALESVPWRDKGGPVFCDEEALGCLIKESKRIVERHRLKGFIWRNFETSSLKNRKYFIEVAINLKEYWGKDFFDCVQSKLRNKLRQADGYGLKFVCAKRNEKTVRHFHKLFRANRKKLGVPTYSLAFFQSIIRNIPDDNLKIFEVRKEEKILSAIIVLFCGKQAIDAYSASTQQALTLKGNDFMIWKTLNWCINRKMQIFYFGADSPLQISLLAYKMKWRGQKRVITDSYFGKVSSVDHNKHKFIKEIIKRTPNFFYDVLSVALVR